jgi:predicted MFS family arabinose efflux permease
VVAAIAQLAFGAPFAMVPLLLSSLVLGFTTQATKVCVDTLVQSNIDDEYRGRVFAVYDTVFNLSFVGGSILAAFVLPTSGKSLPALVAMSVGYLLIAAAYTRSERDLPDRAPQPAHPTC